MEISRILSCLVMDRQTDERTSQFKELEILYRSTLNMETQDSQIPYLHSDSKRREILYFPKIVTIMLDLIYL